MLENIDPNDVREISDHLELSRAQAYEVLAKIDEPELLLLKGHLLIEEALFGLLKHKAKKEEALEKAKLTFAQTLRLVEALYDGEDLGCSNLFSACHQLNKIRNRLAHNAKPTGIEIEIQEFVGCAIKRIDVNHAPAHPLRYALSSVHATFCALLAVHKKIGLLPQAMGAMSFPVRVSLTKILNQHASTSA